MIEPIYYHLIDKNNRIVAYGVCENQDDLNLVISMLHTGELTLQIGEPKKVPYVWKRQWNPFYKFSQINFIRSADISELPTSCENIGDTYILRTGSSSISEYAVWNGDGFEVIKIYNN